MLALPEIKSLFQSERIDLAICDSFAIGCIDAAVLLKIPVILTSTLSMFAGKDKISTLFTITKMILMSYI